MIECGKHCEDICHFVCKLEDDKKTGAVQFTREAAALDTQLDRDRGVDNIPHQCAPCGGELLLARGAHGKSSDQ